MSLEQSQPHLSIDPLLGEHERILHKLALRTEVLAVVEQVTPRMRDELVTERADFAVHDQTLEVHVGVAQDRHGRGVVAAAGFEADVAIFDNVCAADAVDFAEGIQLGEELDGALDGGKAGVWRGDGGGDTFGEGDGDVFGGVGRSKGVVG